MFGVGDVVDYLNKNPQVAAKNLATIRNEGLLKSLTEDNIIQNSISSPPACKGQKHGKRLNKLFLAAIFLSKRAEMLYWPMAFTFHVPRLLCLGPRWARTYRYEYHGYWYKPSWLWSSGG